MFVNVTLNTQRVRKDGKCQVVMYVSLKGRARYAFPIHLEPSKWDEAHKRVRPGGNAIAFNRTIHEVLSRAELLSLDPGATARSIVDRLAMPRSSGLLLGDAIAVVLKERASKFAPQTLERLWFIVHMVGEAIPGATLEGLSAADVYRYRSHLHARPGRLGKHMGDNTLRNWMKLLRTLYWHACSHYRVARLDVWGGSIPREVDVEQRSLSLEEFLAFKAWKAPEAFALSKDAFLLAVYLGGMRVADLCRLRSDRVTTEGLSLRQGKSKAVVYAQISDSARVIIDRYAGGVRVLPLIEEDTMRAVNTAKARLNKGLKVFAYSHGIDGRFSMHWARHVAADLLEAAGTDVRTIQVLFGHSTLQQTVDYLDRRRGKEAGKALKALG